MKNLKRVSLLFLMIILSTFFVACGSSENKNTYSVTFKIGSNVYETTTATQDGIIKPPLKPVREGYIFIGWYDNGMKWDFKNSRVARNLELTAVFKKKCKVVFKVGGSIYYEKTYAEGDLLEPPEIEPTLTGFKFDGWYNGDDEWEFNRYNCIYENLELIAKFSINKYSVKYKVENTVIQNNTVFYGSAISEIEAPEKTGYEFIGWYNGETLWDFNNSVVTTDLEITAKYKPKLFDVIFEIDGEEESAKKIEYLGKINRPTDPEKTGCEFLGWYYNNNLWDFDTDTVTKNIKLIAVFKEIFDVEFKVDGNLYDELEILAGSKLTKPTDPIKEGYTFDAWYVGENAWDFETDVVTSHTQLVAKFNINKYVVTFKVEGNTIDTQEIDFNTKVKKPTTDPVKEHYTFSGWYNGETLWDFNSHVVKTSLELTAKFAKAKYNVKFIVDGNVYETKIVEYNNLVIKPVNPTKTGYTFDCWCYNNLEWNFSNSVTSNMELIAKFIANKYEVRFMVDGVVYSRQQINYDNMLSKPTDPIKTGYTFDGWYNGETIWDFDFYVVKSSFELTAKFTINKYNVVFKVDENDYDSKQVEYNSLIEKPADPEKEGLEFTGWYNNDVIWNFETDKVTNNIELVAKYKDKMCSVVFIVDGVIYSKKEIKYNNKITKPSNPENVGHEFIGWYNGTNEWNFDEDLVVSDLTLVARFDISSYSVTIKVDGNVIETKEVEFGTKLTKPIDPEKEGYDFIGWYNGNVKWNFETDVVSYSMELVAKFEIKKFTITFKVDNSVYTTKEISYGNTIQKPSDPSKTGYTFDGWYNGDTEWNFATGVVKEEFELVARFEIIKYNILLKVDGVIYDSQDVSYGEKLEKPTDPSKTGYRFMGWYNGDIKWNFETDTVISQIELCALFIEEYVITFKVDSSVYKTVTLLKGEDLEKPSDPEKLGFIFMGWYNGDLKWDFENNSVNSNLELVAVFKEACLVTFKVDSSVYKTVSAFKGDKVERPTDPEKQNYTFIGWFNGETEWDFDNDKLSGSVTLTAKFTPIYDDDGYKIIASKETLIAYASDVNNYSVKAKLYADIDLRGMDWTPIGSMNNPYMTEFNGNGFKIINFKPTNTSVYNGLFGYISNATIINLGVENVVSGSVNSDTDNVMSCLVGFATNSNIVNCYAKGSINEVSSGQGIVGGIVGYASGNVLISNCYANVDISMQATDLNYSGGLAGFIENNVTIDNCYATGNINAICTSYISIAGGLVGVAMTSNVADSYSTGNVTVSGLGVVAAGGFIGAVGYAGEGYSIVTNSYVLGNVSISKYDSSRETRVYIGSFESGMNKKIYSENCYTYSGQVITGDATVNYMGQSADKSTIWQFVSNTWEIDVWNLYTDKNPTLKTKVFDDIPEIPDFPEVPNATMFIYSKEDLLSLQGENLNEEIILLMTDIDLEGDEWNPIILQSSEFNGNNHKISNFKITTGAENIGFISYSENSTVKDLTIENIDIDVDYDGDIYVGGLIGYVDTDSVVSNCEITGNIDLTINGKIYLGGLVGEVELNYDTTSTKFDFINNSSDVNITAKTTSIDSYVYAGGLIGYYYLYKDLDLTIDNCDSNGSITIETSSSKNCSIGGLIGELYVYRESKIKIKNNNSSGDISADINADKVYIGGIIGNFYANWEMEFEIDNCDSNGDIVAVIDNSTDCNIAGLVGYVGLYIYSSDSSNNLIENSCYLGNITLNNLTLTDGSALGPETNIGGLIGDGLISDKESIKIILDNCYSMGKFDLTLKNGSNVGGLIGSSYFEVKNCYSIVEMDINMDSKNELYVGGLIGSANSGGSISNSYADVDIKATNTYAMRIGGLVGSNISEVTNCYASGNIEASSNNVIDIGGLLGFSKGSITDCYSTTNLTASSTSYVTLGGLSGSSYSSIKNSYACGDVKASSTEKSLDYGGLVGENHSTISNCYASGYAEVYACGSLYVGGLVASNAYSSTIILDNSYSNCNIIILDTLVPSNIYVGGLVGYNDEGKIEYCYVNATINLPSGFDDSKVGVFVGVCYDGSISHCCSTKYSTNRFIGSANKTTTITNCYGCSEILITDETATEVFSNKTQSWEYMYNNWDSSVWNLYLDKDPTLKVFDTKNA